MKFKPGFNLPLITGLIMGVSAAVAQAYFQVQPPVAYGICLLGHPRDLIYWITNNLLGTNWRSIEIFTIFPTLLVVGVFVGSYMAAYRNKEFKIRPGPVRKKFSAVVFGFLVANFGLLWGSCPIRTGLLVSYGSVMALIALASIVVGVVLACEYVRLRAKKEIQR